MNIVFSDEVLNQAIEWRKKIHANPELAYHEFDTASFVCKKLKEFGLPFESGLGKTGIVATVKGKREGKNTIGLRADMDALAMSESNTFAHASKNPGKMHACGHDGHTAILLLVAEYLSKNNDFAGTCYLIFQPAEEGEAGAKAMIDDGLFQKYPIDEVYGLHNWPGTKPGTFKIKEGSILAANDRFEIKIIGKGCHAAMPEQGHDPILMASHYITQVQNIISRELTANTPAVISVTKINGGSAFNIIPNEVSLGGCIRTLSKETANYIHKRMKEIGDATCHAYSGKFELKIVSGYPATVNSKQETKYALEAAEKTVGSNNIIDKFDSSMGSEDFSFMLQEKPGCYVLLGNGSVEEGSPCMLHNPNYDFNDNILQIGAAYFINLLHLRLK